MLATRAEAPMLGALSLNPAREFPSGVSLVDPLTEATWDARLRAFPEASPFHTQAWARVLAEAYGFRPLYLCLGPAGETRGILPLMSVGTWATAPRAVCLPFSDSCPPLARSAHERSTLVQAACSLASERGWRRVEFRGPIGEPEPPASAEYVRHVIELDGPLAAVEAKFAPSVRRAIRKAGRSDVEISIEHGIDAVRAFVRLHHMTRRRHGAPPQPWRFFRHIHAQFITPDRGFVVLARARGRAVAAAVFLVHGATAVFKFGASDFAHQHLRPNHLAMWAALQHLHARGITRVDLGRSDTDARGLRDFKRSWGSLESPLRYHRYETGKQTFVAGAAPQVGRISPLISFLPSPFARCIGYLAYKHLA